MNLVREFQNFNYIFRRITYNANLNRDGGFRFYLSLEGIKDGRGGDVEYHQLSENCKKDRRLIILDD